MARLMRDSHGCICASSLFGTYFDRRIARWSIDGAVAAPSRIGTSWFPRERFSFRFWENIPPIGALLDFFCIQMPGMETRLACGIVVDVIEKGLSPPFFERHSETVSSHPRHSFSMNECLVLLKGNIICVHRLQLNSAPFAECNHSLLLYLYLLSR